MLTRHLKLWKDTSIPLKYIESELYKYLPKEGLILVKESKVINL